MAYHNSGVVENLLGRAKKKRGPPALMGGPAANTSPPIASVFTMAPGKTWKDFLVSIREGRCLSWGTEMGFTNVLGDVYKLLGKYYRSVTDFKNPDFSTGAKARHFVLAAAALPINVAGLPASTLPLKYAQPISLSRAISCPVNPN